jgi:hypothetical protein
MALVDLESRAARAENAAAIKMARDVFLSFDIVYRPLFDHRESGVKLGWQSGGIGKGGNVGAQFGLGIDGTDSLGDGVAL